MCWVITFGWNWILQLLLNLNLEKYRVNQQNIYDRCVLLYNQIWMNTVNTCKNYFYITEKIFDFARLCDIKNIYFYIWFHQSFWTSFTQKKMYTEGVKVILQFLLYSAFQLKQTVPTNLSTGQSYLRNSTLLK